MNNYLSTLPDDIIDNIYYQLHKKYMFNILLSIPGAVLWHKIKLFHYYPITFFDRVYYRIH